MSLIQSFILKINSKNGTVVIPKKARLALGLQQTMILTIEDGVGKIEVPRYDIEDVLYPEKQTKKHDKSYDQSDFKQAVEEGVLSRFKKGTI